MMMRKILAALIQLATQAQYSDAEIYNTLKEAAELIRKGGAFTLIREWGK